MFQTFQQLFLKTYFSKVCGFLKTGWIFADSPGQFSDQLSLKAAECQTIDSTESVRTSVEPYFKYL